MKMRHPHNGRFASGGVGRDDSTDSKGNVTCQRGHVGLVWAWDSLFMKEMESHASACSPHAAWQIGLSFGESARHVGRQIAAIGIQTACQRKVKHYIFEPMLWRVCRQLIAANTAAPCMTLFSKYNLAVCCFTSNKSAGCAVCVVCIDNCAHHVIPMAISAVSESYLCVVCSYSCVHHSAPKPVQLCLSYICM